MVKITVSMRRPSSYIVIRINMPNPELRNKMIMLAKQRLHYWMDALY